MTLTMLKGKGAFSELETCFTEFLDEAGRTVNSPGAFAARNFLLDEGVSPERADSYRRHGAVARHARYEDWKGIHESYLTTNVFLANSDPSPPDSIDPMDRYTCPETFRLPAVNPFVPPEHGLDLVRMVDLRHISITVGMIEDEVWTVARNGLASRASSPERLLLDDMLEKWVSFLDLRPVYAAFWEDVAELFPGSAAEDQPGWANRLRDRMGLAHFNPSARLRERIRVIVFIYPVEMLPTLRTDRNRRPIVPPTVLDGRHSAAFCPAPRGSQIGSTVDLGASRPLPRREVLHPAIGFRSGHVFRIGEIDAPVDLALLPTVRGLHLQEIRLDSGRPEYGMGTDGDLR